MLGRNRRASAGRRGPHQSRGGKAWMHTGTEMSSGLDAMPLRRNGAFAREPDGRNGTWTWLVPLEDGMQDVIDVMQDVVVDMRMRVDIPVCSTQDAMTMKQGLTMHTVRAATKKHVVSCHQPPWKQGCARGVGANRGGADKHGRRYCYECTSCGSKWNQTRPELLTTGQNPNVRESNRCTNLSDKLRSNGYTCRVCGGKKNAAAAQATGTLSCSCQRKAKVQRQDQPPSAVPHVGVATRAPSTPPLVRGRTQSAPPTDAFLIKAVREHPKMKPGGISLCKWKELLTAVK